MGEGKNVYPEWFCPFLILKMLIYVTERNSNFGIVDCFALNCTLKYCRISQGKKHTLRVKNCLYFDVELFLELMTKFS